METIPTDIQIPTGLPENINPATVAGLGLLAGIGITVYLVVILAAYIYLAICLMTISNKTKLGTGWWAWIPILNYALMLKIAKKPMWWIILLLITPINLFFFIWIWMRIAQAVNKPDWWGILMLIPVFNLFVPGYLAFSKK
ncbi:MAG: DUF5684 domain-containing protein [Patescibacteria group bacterium]|nr:DUF5684 domain-containing protein [Patescibacteria group bacterium]